VPRDRCRSRIWPEALKPLVPFFFPNTQAWPPAAASSPTSLNSASSAGPGPDLTQVALTPQQFAARPPVDVPIPPALMPLSPLLFPKEPDA